jgi:small subunit ribosomal protein S20
LATHKSAEKRARQSVKKQARNTNVKSSVKTFEKNLVKAIETKAKDIETHLKKYMSQISKAAQKGAISKQTASRKISRLAARASAVSK